MATQPKIFDTDSGSIPTRSGYTPVNNTVTMQNPAQPSYRDVQVAPLRCRIKVLLQSLHRLNYLPYFHTVTALEMSFSTITGLIFWRHLLATRWQLAVSRIWRARRMMMVCSLIKQVPTIYVNLFVNQTKQGSGYFVSLDPQNWDVAEWQAKS